MKHILLLSLVAALVAMTITSAILSDDAVTGIQKYLDEINDDRANSRPTECL